ncbi:hypothetical protein QUS53_22600 [Xanthomonas citri pv. citri]|jgi:hypothetical protein
MGKKSRSISVMVMVKMQPGATPLVNSGAEIISLPIRYRITELIRAGKVRH